MSGIFLDNVRVPLNLRENDIMPDGLNSRFIVLHPITTSWCISAPHANRYDPIHHPHPALFLPRHSSDASVQLSLHDSERDARSFLGVSFRSSVFRLCMTFKLTRNGADYWNLEC